MISELSEGKKYKADLLSSAPTAECPQLALHVYFNAEIASFSGAVIQKLVPYTARFFLLFMDKKFYE
jgi:hypothetical protein